MSTKSNHWILRVALFVLLFSGCDGGIVGSGNGGGSPGPVKVPGYHLKYLPEKITADIPSSLLFAAAQGSSEQTGPAVELSKSYGDIAELKLYFSLVQLYTDVAWLDIQAFCAEAPAQKLCDLSGSTISFEYTREMALWESRIRRQLQLVPQASASHDGVIPQVVVEKIGTTITLDAGSYQALQEQQFDHEIALYLPELSSDQQSLYRLSWSNETGIAQAIVTSGIGDNSSRYHLVSLYRNPSLHMKESQQLLYVNDSSGIQNEFQYNQYAVPSESGAFVDSLFRTIDDSGKTETYSRGKADEDGGFLYSQTEQEDLNSVSKTTLQREVFTADNGRNNYSYALCDLDGSIDACEGLIDWQLIEGDEPTNSEFFKTEAELYQISEQVRLYDLKITNVSPDADSYLLLKRENLVVSFGPAGLELTIPGLGSITWPPTEEDVGQIDALGTDSFGSIEDSFVCRIIPVDSPSQQDFRTYCAALEEDIANALVVSEFYESGRFRIEWEANANIEINP